MRFLELGLLAYGPFTGVRIDLSAPPPALHVIHGRNEAGKSTTLRALGDVLFEIPSNTADAYVHAMSELRLAAKLETRAGVQLGIQRRKGKTGRTLLDASGEPLEEAVLERMLGGVDRRLFETMFALGHAQLRDGAQALLEGRGDVRESLYDAGIGGRGIHDVLSRLEAEADAIFKERGSKLRLNLAIAAFQDAKKRSVDSCRAASAYDAQVAERDRLKGERERLDGRRRALNEESARLQRWLRVLPHLGDRRVQRERRAGLGDVVLLAADARERRVEIERELDGAAREAKRLAAAAEIEELRLQAIPVPGSIVAIDEDRMARLEARLAVVRDAAEDLPKRRAELRVREEEARAITAQLGWAEGGNGPDQLRLDKAASGRVRKLAQERARIDAALEGSRQALAAKRARLGRTGDAAGPGAAADTRGQGRDAAGKASSEAAISGLAAAVARARAAGDVDGAVRAADAAVEKHEALAKRGAALLGLDEDLAAAVRRPVPVPASVDRFAREEMAHAQETVRLRERAREADLARAQARRLADELQRAGDVPTEAGLAAARARRDELWAVVRKKATAARGKPSTEELDGYEASGRDADAVADRLRREAERVARLAGALAQHDEADRAAAQVLAEQRDLAARSESLAKEWAALWAPAGVAPATAPEMQQWLARFAKLVEVAADRDAAIERRQIEHRRAATLAADLDAALASTAGAAGAPAPSSAAGVAGTSAESLAARLERAAGALAAIERAEARQARLAETVNALQAEIVEDEAKIGELEASLDAWAQHWIEAVAPLGISAEQDPDVAVDLLDEIAALVHKRKETLELRRRIAGMEQDASDLAAEANALVAEHAPEIGSATGAIPLAAELLRRWREARQDREQRESATERLAGLREDLAQEEIRRAVAGEQLAALVAAARVPDAAALPDAEDRAAEARRIDERLREIEDAIAAASDGQDVEAMIAETTGLDPHAAKLRVGDLAEELEGLGEEIKQLDRDLGGVGAGLATFGGGAAAAEASAEAQEQLAAVRALGRRWVQTHLAAVILRREIERYRAANQGPILGRASQLFPRLTLGEYTTLRPSIDDDVLECVKPGGATVRVEQLSDGARDALYLALRLASLDHYARTAEPMPLVLDDVLITLDEERTRAALEVLGEVAAHTQVILFTHHAHVLKIAKKVLGARLIEHTIERPRSKQQQVLPLD